MSLTGEEWMKSTFVERLRSANMHSLAPGADEMISEAAERIEALEAELAQWKQINHADVLTSALKMYELQRRSEGRIACADRALEMHAAIGRMISLMDRALDEAHTLPKCGAEKQVARATNAMLKKYDIKDGI